MKILNSFILSFCLLFAFGAVLAQETENGAAAVALDENVTAEDLGIREPNVLPDSPLYFFKNLGRAIQSAITLNPVKKTELKERFANEKLIELKKLAEKTKNHEVIKKAAENYEKEIERVRDAAEKISETASTSDAVSKFLDKFIQQQTLHQRILEKLETQVATTTMAKIREARERHLEKFGEVMTRLEEKDKIPERLEKNLEKVKGSEFKNFKNLEMLKALEEKVPEAAKGAIQKAQENTLKRLQGDVEKMSSDGQTRFQDYIEKIGGVKEKQVEILENLREQIKNAPMIKERLLETRKNILEQAREEVGSKNEDEDVACPQIQKPASTFCQNGRLVIKKDDKGCIVAFNCVVPAETNIPTTVKEAAACVTLWNPVCGKDNNTYSNACFAKLAGVEIASEGACKSLDTGISPQIREQIKSLVPQVLTPTK